MWRSELEQHYRLYSTSGINNAALFLEAAIHEFFAMVDEHPSEFLPDMPDADRALLAEYWDANVRAKYPDERHDVHDRYNAALTIAGREPFDTGDHTVRGVRCLFDFCHSLGHYSPAWEVVPAQPELSAVERGLADAGFLLNPFHSGEPFPSLYLSHGCAEWALLTALDFYAQYCFRMGIPNKLDGSGLFLSTTE